MNRGLVTGLAPVKDTDMGIVTAKVIAHAFDSKNAIQYFPGDVVDLDLGNPHQRKLVWLRTPRGRWVFDFDRAGASDVQQRIWFCKECGQPFDRLNDIGTHNRQQHNANDKAAALAKADTDAETEARLLADEQQKVLLNKAIGVTA